MHMVIGCGSRDECPSSPNTNVRNDVLDKQSLLDRQNARGEAKPRRFDAMPIAIAADDWIAKVIHTAIDGSAFVAVETSAIGTPGDVICHGEEGADGHGVILV